jgi:aminoglycoside phosphotransferase (APT) family kinase protein
MRDPEPTEQDAAFLVRQWLEREPISVSRFATGLVNYVYEVRDASGDAVVVRLNRVGQGENFAGAVYWYHRLVPLGVPLPRLLCHDASPADGSFPFMITARVPGQDLDGVYPALDVGEKRTLAAELVEVQAAVGRLPLGPGFGYARSYTDPSLHPTWMEFLHAELAWSRDKIQRAGLVDPASVDLVAGRIEAYQPHFETVEPRCFLDDIALKNVLMLNGHVSGIVDVDWVCFGDALLPLALTYTRLLRRGWDTEYVSFWINALDLGKVRKRALTLYTALWIVNSLGLIGQRFGNGVETPVDGGEIATLMDLLDEVVSQL